MMKPAPYQSCENEKQGCVWLKWALHVPFRGKMHAEKVQAICGLDQLGSQAELERKKVVRQKNEEDGKVGGKVNMLW